MNYNNFWKHVIDVVKGAAGAALTVAMITFMQYLGAHIPDLVQLLAVTSGGVAGVKAHLNHLV